MMADSPIYSFVFDVARVGLLTIEIGVFERFEAHVEARWKVLHGCVHFQLACNVVCDDLGAVWSLVVVMVGVCSPNHAQHLKITHLAWKWPSCCVPS